jgi:hypothetical protein
MNVFLRDGIGPPLDEQRQQIERLGREMHRLGTAAERPGAAIEQPRTEATRSWCHGKGR